MKLKIKKTSENARIPSYAHVGDACFDISVIVGIGDEEKPLVYSEYEQRFVEAKEVAYGASSGKPEVTIRPGNTVMFHTGLKFETEYGYCMKVHVRSSTGIKKNLILSNCTGVIDTAQYRGEMMVALTNIGSTVQKVHDGERVAQGEIQKCIEVEIEEVSELSETERGEGGIGSTGGH